MQNPLGWCWLILAMLALWQWRHGARRQAGVLGGLCLLLTLTGGTPLPALLLRTLERPYTVHPPLTPVDAIVILGGGYAASSTEASGFKVNSAFDRITAGMTALDRGFSTNLVLGGGAEWTAQPGRPGSDALQPWLARHVPPQTRIHSLNGSRTTREEAVDCAALAHTNGWSRILLVTSGSHMPRASATFRAQGLTVIPAGSAFEGHARLAAPKRWSLIPTPSDLRLFELWFHEIMGRLYYRMRGWTVD